MDRSEITEQLRELLEMLHEGDGMLLELTEVDRRVVALAEAIAILENP